MAETARDCSLQLSVELKFLEAEYERSKLSVYRDTLICQTSKLELDLLCTKEELRKKIRSNAELTGRSNELQINVRSLEEEVADTKDLLQRVERTLANERNQSKKTVKELRREFEADLKRKLHKERQDLEGVRAVMLRDVQKWKEKSNNACAQVGQLKDELRQENQRRQLKNKAMQVEVTQTRVHQNCLDPAQPSYDTTTEEESSSSAIKQLEAERSQRKALPESLKDRKDAETHRNKREVRGKKTKKSQMEEHCEDLKEMSHPAPSDTNVRQKKKRVTRKQKAKGEEIHLLESVTHQDMEVQGEAGEKLGGDGKNEENAEMSEKGKGESDAMAKKSLSKGDKAAGSITEAVRQFPEQETGKKSQGRKTSKANRNNRRNAKKDNKAGKCLVETQTPGERKPEEGATSNSEASKATEEPEERATEDRGTKGQERNEAKHEEEVAEEVQESIEEELKKAIGKDEQGKPQHCKEKEVKTKKGKQRQRKGKKQGLPDQAKEKVSQENAVNVKRQQRKTPRKQISGENKPESAENEDKLGREKLNETRLEETKDTSETTKVEQHLQNSAEEVNAGAGEKEKPHKSQRRLRREKQAANNELAVDEEEEQISGSNSQKRCAVLEEARGPDSKKSRSELRSSQQDVSNSRDDIKTAGITRAGTNPSASPEIGKANNLAKPVSCGDAATSSLTDAKTGELSSTVNSGKFALQATCDLHSGPVQDAGPFDATRRTVNPDSNHSGMNMTDASAEQSGETHENNGKRRRKPAPIEKSGKENAPKKRKPNSPTVDVAPKTSGTSFPDMSSILNGTRRRKGLLNVRDNSFMVAPLAQESFFNTTVSRGQSISGMPPRLNDFMKSFIAPKLLRNKSQ